MDILLGTAALSASVLGYAWALGLTRSATSPAWAHSQLFATTICLIIVGLAPLGIGYLAYGFGKPFDTLAWAGLGTLALSVPLLWLVAPRLARKGRVAVQTGMPVPPPTPAPVEPTFKLAA